MLFIYILVCMQNTDDGFSMRKYCFPNLNGKNSGLAPGCSDIIIQAAAQQQM
jgi:hypothetical protein